MPAARRIARRRPLVFNPLVSLEDTLVDDRGRYRAGSPGAAVLRQIDRIAFRRADLVVADTEQHARFFASRFGLPPERVDVCLLGADDALFRPGWRPPSAFHVLFVGKLIPLHGVETILAAARIAAELPFRIVGSGQLDAMLAERPANVEWVPWIDYEGLPAAYQSAGCALGLLGTSDKAGRVIPNKAYHALACGTPLVTADTPAARELLEHERNALLVPPGDAQALAAAVRRLAADPDLAARLGDAGRATYEAAASEEVLGARWRRLLEQLLRER
jgi:glycosyltransferase involved in cell wall biosynthesis